ncbi:MAG: HpcH/HpaI aldolase/citrate lyase family protein [Burkholderiaceae bacterium]
MTAQMNPVLGRSLLFVPGNRPERFDKALLSGGDAVILDLEDAVPEAEKPGALESVAVWLAARPADEQRQCWVRVPDARNPSPDLLRLADCAGFTGFVLPKVESPDDLCGWSVPLIAQIESATGVQAMPAIAQTDQALLALAIGPEDLAASLGTEPGFDALHLSCSLAVIAARAAARQVIACPGSIGEFRDLDAWRQTLEAGRRLGSDGMMCIHPAQVSVANEVFSPSLAAIEQAGRIVAAARAGQALGQGAVKLDGRMIDPPVVVRAENLLTAARRFGLV